MDKIIRIGRGDTFESITRTFGVPAYVLKKVNGISELKEGMRIVIPFSRGEKYSVKPFEDVESVCIKFGMGKDTFEKLNPGVNEIFIGQIIYVLKEK